MNALELLKLEGAIEAFASENEENIREFIV